MFNIKNEKKTPKFIYYGYLNVKKTFHFEFSNSFYRLK